MSRRDAPPRPEPIPRLWPGEAAVLVGSGCSLDFDDVRRCRAAGLRVIACNDNYVTDPDLLYVADRPWAAANWPSIAAHPFRWTSSASVASVGSGWHLVQIDPNELPGLSSDPELIHHGSNAGYQMLNIAVLLGLKRLVLTGYDMKWGPGGRPRWKGGHGPGIEQCDDGKFAGWRRRMATTVPPLQCARVEVVNCTRDTALECFPIRPLDSVLAEWGAPANELGPGEDRHEPESQRADAGA